MAKWGEGDPRWIVEERPDAINVNNWHWTEKDASLWSKERLTELLTGIKIDDATIGYVETINISSIEGEAIVNNRKGKLIFFYEWVIKGVWAGKLNNFNESIKGQFEIPNLSEENEAHEIVVNLTYTDNQDLDQNGFLKEFFRIKGTELIQNKISIYIKELKEEYAKNLILPTKDSVQKQDVTKSVTKINKSNLDKITFNNLKYSKDTENLAELKSIDLTENLKCKPSEFYAALTNEKIISMFTQCKATVSPVVDGEFILFDGSVQGKYIELVPDKLIKQEWRFKNWPKNYYSIVTIKIESTNDGTLIILNQEGVPSNDYERTKSGWNRYYFDAMKRILGFGTFLY